jgi:hypothetical protein
MLFPDRVQARRFENIVKTARLARRDVGFSEDREALLKLIFFCVLSK